MHGIIPYFNNTNDRSMAKTVHCCSNLSIEASVGVRHSPIRPSLPLPSDKCTEVLNKSIRHFSKKEVHIKKDCVLGSGVFGKCFLGVVGHFDTCVKFVRLGAQYKASFYNEANILSHCCHPNISFLLGICLEWKCPTLILAFHGDGDKSYTLHSVLKHSKLDLTCTEWKLIISSAISGIKYLHEKSIIHNDIKEDNITLTNIGHKIKSVVIDFGKACFVKNGKKYNLSAVEKRRYKLVHPQVPPDVVDGIRIQDKLSDVYSFGRILKSIAEDKLPVPALASISKECLLYNANDRPTIDDLYVFTYNLFQ